MVSGWDILEGFKETFRMDDPRYSKPRKPVCRECEIVGSAFCFSVGLYMQYLARMRRITPLPGFTGAAIFGTLGLSLLMSFPPDPVAEKLKQDKINQVMARKDES